MTKLLSSLALAGLTLLGALALSDTASRAAAPQAKTLRVYEKARYIALTEADGPSATSSRSPSRARATPSTRPRTPSGATSFLGAGGRVVSAIRPDDIDVVLGLVTPR